MPLQQFFWNQNAGQYIRADGRFVARSEVRRAVDVALRAEARRARTLANDFRAGRISLMEWRSEMQAMVKESHIYSAAVAQGGIDGITPEAFARIEQTVNQEFGYLDNLAREVSSGQQPVDGRFQQRVVQYSQAGRDTFHQTERAVMLDAGFTHEQNILHPADHCVGCLDATAQGRVRIGQLTPIGRRDCRRNCKCTLAYSRGA